MPSFRGTHKIFLLLALAALVPFLGACAKARPTFIAAEAPLDQGGNEPEAPTIVPTTVNNPKLASKENIGTEPPVAVNNVVEYTAIGN